MKKKNSDIITIKSTCRLCYNSCGVLIDMQNGVPVKIRGDRNQSLSQGHLCQKGIAALEVLNHPQRLKTPLRRTITSGKVHWQAIQWDEALDRVAHGLDLVKKKHGPESVIFARGGSKGMADDYLTRFANQFGSPNITGAAYICYSPCFLASKHTYGFFAYPDLTYPPKSVVLWGFNPKVTHPPVYRELKLARDKGAKIILIDPAHNVSAKNPFHWLRPKPGTDLALALGIIHVIINKGLYDKKFVTTWTTGLNRLKNKVVPYTPQKVEEITWVDQDLIRSVAGFICKEKPGCILWGNALEATPDSYQTCRAICIIRALTGNLGVPGSDISMSDLGELRRRSAAFLLTDRLLEKIRSKRLGAHAGLLPDFGYAPHHQVVKAILESRPYPIRGAYVQNANMVCANEDAVKTEAALKRLDFLVATDMFMTPTARLADIVLPSASYLEFDSVEQPWHSPTAFVQQKVAQCGQARSDGDILNALGKRLGLDQTWKNMEQALDFYLEPAGISFAEFRQVGELSGPRCYRDHEKKGFPTPTGKVELYSSFLENLGFDPLPTISLRTEVIESEKNKYPLILTSRKSSRFYHSSGRQILSLRNSQPDPMVYIHPQCARDREITEGDWIFIETPKGAIIQKVCLARDLDPRVIMAEHGWWFPELGEAKDWGSNRSNLNLITDGDKMTNREIGSSTLRGIACNISKAGPDPSIIRTQNGL
ncbi:MAG: molybdopterin-dependent oxidoreductase [Desulfobacterium sp.]